MTKKKYKCLWCRRTVNLWPDVFAGDCPKCGKGSLLHELMDRGEVSVECPHCGTVITSWVTVMQGKCHKCDQPHRIADRIADAKREVQSKRNKHRKITFYSVICSKCKRRIESSALVEEAFIPVIFPTAGICALCGVVCWSCATMYRASGVQEANELRAMGNAGTLVALQDSEGNIMSPRCPSCNSFLEEIRRGHESFSVVRIRKTVPGKKWWHFWK
jgi:Zn finger protein HypA/HybF involved in hydrogenase expression